jgi:hypothetical protein
MESVATSLAGILSRNSLARQMPRDPEERRTWLAELADTEPVCPLCDGELPPEAIREHLCCICLDGGFLRSEGKAVPCSCRLTGIPEQEFIKRSGIPGSMKSYSLSTWGGNPKFLEIAQAYVAGWPPVKPVMFLTGVVGGGKTGLSVGILRELWSTHHKVGRFVSAPDLIQRFIATFREDATEAAENIHTEMATAALIVLDDYGTEKGTEFAQQEMYRLINGRSSRGQPLIVTTNLEVQSLDPRIKSRLVDRERSTWMEFAGADRREM